MKVNANHSGDFRFLSEKTSQSVVDNLAGYLDGRAGWVDFEDIRQAVIELQSVSPGALHQACFDAGYTDIYHE